MANVFDRLIEAVAPMAALRRAQARRALSFYEAAKPSTQRKFRQAGGSPNHVVSQGAVALRNQVRHLDKNHDITRGAISVLVNNTVGPDGIGVEFQPRRADGSIHAEYAAALTEAYRDWQRRPEVTWEHSWAQCQRLAARTKYRDGEVFAQRIRGTVPSLDHGTRVPYSIELWEPDLVPMDYDDEAKGIRQGIQRNAWGRKTGVWVAKGHPEESNFAAQAGLKFLPADRLLHAACRDRIGQGRGVTPFASVITRVEDLKDYEESERIAAKVAAMLTAYVTRKAPDGAGYEPNTDEAGNAIPRELSLQPGTIIDTLAVGEEVGLIDSKRPNPNLITFRNGQLRAMAAGIGASYSSISRNYDGTYSAQRQEMVEQWTHYACLTDDFVSQFIRPVVEDFIELAHLSGVARRPADVAPDRADDVLYVAPNMPWIDPAKEALGWLTLCQAGFASEVEVIRRRGGKPADVLQQIAEHRRRASELGVRLSTEPPQGGAPQPDAKSGPAKEPPEDADQKADE